MTEAFRRVVLRVFVRLEFFDNDQAAGMLTWPHSGFHVRTAVWDDPFGSPRTIARSVIASDTRPTPSEIPILSRRPQGRLAYQPWFRAVTWPLSHATHGQRKCIRRPRLNRDDQWASPR